MPFLAATDNCIYRIGETIKAVVKPSQAKIPIPGDITLLKGGSYPSASRVSFPDSLRKEFRPDMYHISFTIGEHGRYFLAIQEQGETFEGCDFWVLDDREYAEYWRSVCDEEFVNPHYLKTPKEVFYALKETAEELFRIVPVREWGLVEFKLDAQNTGEEHDIDVPKEPLEWVFQRWLETFLREVFLGGSINLVLKFENKRPFIEGSIRSSAEDWGKRVHPLYEFPKHIPTAKGISILNNCSIKQLPEGFDINIR